MLVDITLAKANGIGNRKQSQLPVFDRDWICLRPIGFNTKYRGSESKCRNRRHQGWRYQPQITEYFQIDHALIGSLYADAKLPNNCKTAHASGRLAGMRAALLVNEEGALVFDCPGD